MNQSPRFDRSAIAQHRPQGGQGAVFVRSEMQPPLAPPADTVGLVHWVRENLFASWGSTLATLAAAWALWVIIPPLFQFALLDAVWTGDGRAACTTAAQGGVQADGWFGACWAYVGTYMERFLYGRYPEEELWRVRLVAVLLLAGMVPLLIARLPFKRETIAYLAVIFPVTAFILLSGGNISLDGFLIPDAILPPGTVRFWVDFGLVTGTVCVLVALLARSTEKPVASAIGKVLAIMGLLGLVIGVSAHDFGLRHVETAMWGGLLVTMVIAVAGIAASLPLGILLALGRRSRMPVVRILCISFIEFWRGVPLITVLFMSSVMLPLFLPTGMSFDKLLRALVGVALFSSAYMAEVIRGGLQAVPKGQYEGAQALGLPYAQTMRLIILPQALKLVIPGIVNTFISLFKDTTLVLIIGLFDFLGMIQLSFKDPAWASPVQSLTGYLFAAIIFFLFCYCMSRYSIHMERRLDTGPK